MSNLLAVLDADSLKPAAGLARDLGGARVVLFDPTLVPKAHDAGIGDFELRPWCSRAGYAELTAWAHREAFALERRLDRSFAELFDGASFVGWQHLNLYYLLLALRWYGELADAEAVAFEGGTTHVFVHDNPAHYYWPSFVPALRLLQRLVAQGVEIKAYTFGRRAEAWSRVPDLRGAADRRIELLTHLPTCFHDAAWLREEIAASGRRVLDLRARQWDVEVGAAATSLPLIDQATLEATLDAAARARIDTFGAQVREQLEPWLQHHLSSATYRERQAGFLADLVRNQLVTFEALGRHFEATRPAQLLVSEHDAGFHGPLLAWAARSRVPVTFVPHSKTVGDFEFVHHRHRVLTHPIQPEAPSDPAGARVPTCRLAYPEQLVARTALPQPLRRVGLLLNGLSLNGVLSTPYADYQAALQRIAGWCRARGLALAVRSRPGQVMTQMLEQATGLSPEAIGEGLALSLDAFARSVDLCLMLDAPTNAAVEFLRQGVPLLNPVLDTLSRAEALTCDPALVPRDDLEGTLARLDRLADDPTELHVLARRQFARYAAGFDGAMPLRSFL